MLCRDDVEPGSQEGAGDTGARGLAAVKVVVVVVMGWRTWRGRGPFYVRVRVSYLIET